MGENLKKFQHELMGKSYLRIQLFLSGFKVEPATNLAPVAGVHENNFLVIWMNPFLIV